MPKPHCKNPSCTWSVEVAQTSRAMNIPGVTGVVPAGTKVETTKDSTGCQDVRPGMMKPHKVYRVVENPPEEAGV